MRDIQGKRDKLVGDCHVLDIFGAHARDGRLGRADGPVIWCFPGADIRSGAQVGGSDGRGAQLGTIGSLVLGADGTLLCILSVGGFLDGGEWMCVIWSCLLKDRTLCGCLRRNVQRSWYTNNLIELDRRTPWEPVMRRVLVR